MKPIAFTKDETRAMVRALQSYFTKELDQDLGTLPAEMMIEFLGRQIGPTFYNRGVRDAEAVFNARAEDMSEAILGLERFG